jgi:peptide/nickel transport system substrate-binding protein
MFNVSFVSFNSDGAGKDFFIDPKVRLALVQAIDRQRIVTEVLAGRADPDPSPIPVGAWAWSAAAAALHPYDQLAASGALDKAGWVVASGAKVRTKNNVQFKVELVAPDSYPNRQVADAVARQLLEVGVEVHVNAVPASQLVQKYLLGRNYQMALASFDVGPDPDQYSLWHSGADSGSLNFAYTRGWGLIDSDLENGRATVDPQARLAAYIDFQMLMADAAPAIFLYSAHYDYAVSGRVHGVRMNKVIEPADRFQYVTQWYVNTSG